MAETAQGENTMNNQHYSTAESCTDAFNNAINRGLMSIDEACDYMYMYTRIDADGHHIDVFKNVDTRHHETVTRIQD